LCTRPGLMGERAYDLLHARGTTHPQHDLAQQVSSMAPNRPLGSDAGRVRSPSRFKCSSPTWLPLTIFFFLVVPFSASERQSGWPYTSVPALLDLRNWFFRFLATNLPLKVLNKQVSILSGVTACPNTTSTEYGGLSAP
jgi:hypothetical protein